MSDGSGEVPLDDIERFLLGGRRTLTRVEVAAQAGVTLELAEELWSQLGFARTDDDDVAFTERDVTALRMTAELVSLGILEPDSQSALVRTWGRSYARLAEWQAELLGGLALRDEHPERRIGELVEEVTPRVQELQDYVWRRHLVSAAERLLATIGTEEKGQRMAVAFTDIVGYTSRSKSLTEHELVDLVETFEDETTRAVVAVGGRVIKTIGDEVLFVAESPRDLVDVALTLTARGEDGDDAYPRVRAGIAYGAVTTRLGDVFGPVVNIAARLTSHARPGAVLVDRGAFEALTGRDEPDGPPGDGSDPGPGSRSAWGSDPRAGAADGVPDGAADGVPDGASDGASDGAPDTAPDGTPLARLIDRAADELAELSPYAEHDDLRFRRLRRTSVKGYRALEPWVVRRRWPRDDVDD